MPTADSSTRRIHIWSGLIVLGVFLAGAAAGAGVMAALRRGGPRFPPPHHDGWFPPHLNELDLTEDQQKRAKVIFEKYHAVVEATVKETFPRVRAAQEQMERELRAILTDAQAKKLDEIQAHRPPPRLGGPGLGGPGPLGPGPGPRGPPPGFGPPPDGAPPPPEP